MAFTLLNGFDVEHASSMLVYENLFPEIQHINGKGCVDTYTKTADVESVTYIDVMRVLPYLPRFRQLGSANNGGYHNAKNEGGYGNAPQSVHYTIPVDLIYDEGIAITQAQIYSNPVALKSVVLAQLVKVAGMSINIITYAKQIEAFFRNGDNFDKALTHTKGSIVAGDITASEIAAAVFTADATAAANASGSYVDAFVAANSQLSEGITEIGALVVPLEERQAFISNNFDRIMKRQYMTNASEAAAKILANGFINPFTNSEGVRITSATGLAGTYDGVDMFILNKVVRNFIYTALGATTSTLTGYLDDIEGMIVYGAGTCRGIVGPSVVANPNVYFGGVYILPKMKVGVEVLHGATIKLIVKNSTAWTTNETATIVALMNALTFTAIDGVTVTASTSGFNTGLTN